MLATLTEFIINMVHSTQFAKVKDNVANTMDTNKLIVKWIHKQGYSQGDDDNEDMEEEYIGGNPTSSIQKKN